MFLPAWPFEVTREEDAKRPELDEHDKAQVVRFLEVRPRVPKRCGGDAIHILVERMVDPRCERAEVLQVPVRVSGQRATLAFDCLEGSRPECWVVVHDWHVDAGVPQP